VRRTKGAILACVVETDRGRLKKVVPPRLGVPIDDIRPTTCERSWSTSTSRCSRALASKTAVNAWEVVVGFRRREELEDRRASRAPSG
jgi:hypothetical protein